MLFIGLNTPHAVKKAATKPLRGATQRMRTSCTTGTSPRVSAMTGAAYMLRSCGHALAFWCASFKHDKWTVQERH